MNCVNHPETPVSAFCQNCGKALCQECVRSVGGVVYCESCLEARLRNPNAAQPGTAPGSVPLYVGLPASGFPNPGLALGLGFIPGVGAMYNGQFVKGLAHVIIFALLVSLANHEGPFGILVAFWVAYQVFDSYQTARARRDGTPLPNPFGLNDLGVKLGLQQHPEINAVPYVAGSPAPGVAPNATAIPGVPYNPAPGQPSTEWTSYVPPEAAQYGQAQYGQQQYAAGFVPGNYADPAYTPGAPGMPPPPYPPNMPGAMMPGAVTGRSDIPTGAIVLISLGVLFLLSSLGIFHDDWLGRSWPLFIIAIGVWLVFRRMRDSRLAVPPAQPGERNPR